MQPIQRNTMQQISGGRAGFVEWLRQLFTPAVPDEPDRWVHEELNHNAQY
ncbi:hypothetical protein [Herbaspirillum sp. YR522]|nr:hypothetical protein [Herbaspirillum sp. YR522]EJN08423.1 hypothetical protein PMI40_01284 [Herbaspirillum sp. YR522]